MIPPSLIARYRCYGGDNNAADRGVLKDLSGNGNDITLNNFAWSGESGYGSYAIDFTNIHPNVQDNLSVYEKSHDKIKFSLVDDSATLGTPLYMRVTGILVQKKFKIRSTHDMELRDSFESNYHVIATIPSRETVEVTLSDTDDIIFFYLIGNVPAGEVVELYQEPYHKGALVFDGVDDYGLCDTFSIPKDGEDGFTVIALRRWIGDTKNSVFLSTADPTGIFLMEDSGNCMVGGDVISINRGTTFPKNFCVYMTDKSYNGEIDFGVEAPIYATSYNLSIGAQVLNLGGSIPDKFANIALYALEIYSRRLSEDEINRVRDRLMEEYLRETNCLDGLEYVAEWQTYGKTNTDEDRDVLKDLSGNGHDITLYNFDFTEQSGYNTTDYKGALVTDGVDDYGRTTAIDDEVGTMLSRLVPLVSQGQSFYLETSSFDSNTSPYRLYIWNSVKDTPSILQGIKDESGYVDNVLPYLSLVREPVSLGGRHLCLSSSSGGRNPTTMAFWHLILIRQKCTVEQVECLKWLMDKKYRDYLKNN